MNGFRFIHAADLHLDSPFRGMSHLPDAIRHRVRESTFLAFQNIVSLAIREKVDFLLIAGDVFDLADRSLRAQIRFRSMLEPLAERRIPVYVIHGNHDPLDGQRASLSWPENVTFFKEEVEVLPVLRVEKSVTGTTISEKLLAHMHGYSYPTAKVFDNLVPHYKRRLDAPYAIGLLHTNVDGDANHDNYAPSSKRELIASGLDYWALGHVHTRQTIHENPYIVYPGNIQGRSIRETGPRGCYLVDVSNEGLTRLTFHAVDTLRWHQEDVSIQGLMTEQELLEKVERSFDAIRQSSSERPHIVRLTLSGRGAVHRALLQDHTLRDLTAFWRDNESLRNDFVWLESLHIKTGREIDRDRLLEEENLLGDLLRYARAIGIDEKLLSDLDKEALAPLWKHGRASKYLEPYTPDELRQWLREAEEIAIDRLLEEA